MRGAIVALGLVFGCGAPRWQAVSPRPGAVYRYDAPIERYAPDDAGLWIVAARDATPAGRRRLAAALADPDDVAGDGFVLWATAERAGWWRAHPDVGSVTPLQPADRLRPLPADPASAAAVIAMRIELAPESLDAQRDAIVAWLAGRGVTARTVGARTLDADLAPPLARELAAFGPVRWIAPRGAMR
jgi:hypothetical protein